MRLYVMARTREMDRVRTFMADARDAGHVISHDWTVAVEAYGTDDIAPHLAWECARADLERGVTGADACVFLADAGDFCGALIEYGYALALGVPIFLVAPWRPSIFWQAPTTVILPDETAVRDMLGMTVRVAEC